jgi:uncharacterized repeat protein (TIGR03843 family)
MRPATSARGRTATTSTEPAAPEGAPTPGAATAGLIERLRTGELEVLGRLVGSSNNAMVVRVWPAGTRPEAFAGELVEGDLLAVWKPTIGERPLFDFPIGTLTRREVAAYLVSEALGWGIVPPTLLREGPYGEGMVQLWIDADPAADVVDLVNGDDPRLRRIALLDAVLNNTDRKAGHLLPIPGGHLHAVDHGVTFSIEPKLRTVLWAWEGEPFEPDEVAGLTQVRAALGEPAAPGHLGSALAELLFVDEVAATRARIDDLLAAGRFPSPNPEWPAIPWPPY